MERGEPLPKSTLDLLRQFGKRPPIEAMRNVPVGERITFGGITYTRVNEHILDDPERHRILIYDTKGNTTIRRTNPPRR
jgi:hypothetical protein